MEVVHLTHASEQINTEPHVMAIGFFDGIHIGHQELLNHAKKLAMENNILFTAMTFSPHPDEVIKGVEDRKYLMTWNQKKEQMAAMGVDKLFVMKFDRTFASLLPADFIKRYILGMNTRHVVVGFDFTFGFKAQGNTEYLHKESSKSQFGLSVIPKKTYLNEKISSTLIKGLIQEGKIDQVPYYLGSSYKVNATMITHQQTGNVMIKPWNKHIFPNPGSYYVEVVIGKKTIQGELHQYSHAEMDNELVMSEPCNALKKDCTLVFLRQHASARTVPV